MYGFMEESGIGGSSDVDRAVEKSYRRAEEGVEEEF